MQVSQNLGGMSMVAFILTLLTFPQLHISMQLKNVIDLTIGLRRSRSIRVFSGADEHHFTANDLVAELL